MRLGVTILKMCKSNSFVTIRKGNDEKTGQVLLLNCRLMFVLWELQTVQIGREDDDSFGVVDFVPKCNS